MGYDLHITRREHWSDEGDDIAAEEWLGYVAHDPELRLAPENGPCFAAWSGQCEYEEPWFDWRRGAIYTKNPDIPITRKMIAIARALNARVVGDDGEEYGEDGLPLPDPDRRTPSPPQAPLPATASRKAWGAIALICSIAGIYLGYFANVTWGRSVGVALIGAAALIFWLADPDRGNRKVGA